MTSLFDIKIDFHTCRIYPLWRFFKFLCDVYRNFCLRITMLWNSPLVWNVQKFLLADPFFPNLAIDKCGFFKKKLLHTVWIYRQVRSSVLHQTSVKSCFNGSYFTSSVELGWNPHPPKPESKRVDSPVGGVLPHRLLGWAPRALLFQMRLQFSQEMR